MIVRCGRCRTELEVSGPGQFVCPVCGTRNAVREQPAAAPTTLDLSGIRSTPPPASAAPPPGIRWVLCPGCSYRFAIGEVDQVTCPNCGARSDVTAEGLRAAPA